MYKSLYDNFKHWFHDGRGQVWFYSDPHFSEEEMQYLRAGYIDDDEQVRRINSKLGKYDTLVILGDLGNTEYVKKLKGYKVLIMGNHDSGASNYKREIKLVENNSYTCPRCGGKVIHETSDILGPNCTWCPKCGSVKLKPDVYDDNHLFDEVFEGPLFISDKLLLSHEPIDFPYALNIHGHDHSLWSKPDDLHWNVCAEHIDYTPICLKTIVNSGRLKKIPSIHRMTIDEATRRSQTKERGQNERQ